MQGKSQHPPKVPGKVLLAKCSCLGWASPVDRNELPGWGRPGGCARGKQPVHRSRGAQVSSHRGPHGTPMSRTALKRRLAAQELWLEPREDAQRARVAATSPAFGHADAVCPLPSPAASGELMPRGRFVTQQRSPAIGGAHGKARSWSGASARGIAPSAVVRPRQAAPCAPNVRASGLDCREPRGVIEAVP